MSAETETMIQRVARIVFVMAPDEGWPTPAHPRCVHIARTIIEQMREPTKEMIRVGAEECFDDHPDAHPYEDAADVWRAMVEEAAR